MINLIFSGDAILGRRFNDKFKKTSNLDLSFKNCFGNI